MADPAPDPQALVADHLDRAVVLNTETRTLAGYFERYDILLTPSLAGPALELGVMDTSNPDLDGFMERLFAVSPFTAPFDVTGQPALNMPLHESKAGMPIGVQLIGRFAEDAHLLQLARTPETQGPRTFPKLS
jgi:amidase